MLNDRYYLAMSKVPRPKRKKPTFDEIVNYIIENPDTAPIYPDEIARPILRAVGQTSKLKTNHWAITRYALRLSRMQCLFLIRIAIIANFDYAISGDTLGGFMALILEYVGCKNNWDMMSKANDIREGRDKGDFVNDDNRDFVCDFIAMKDASPTDPYYTQQKVANSAKFATKIKGQDLENADKIINNYASDNPKLYMTHEFQEYENANRQG
jgi:hypothetical protein